MPTYIVKKLLTRYTLKLLNSYKMNIILKRYHQRDYAIAGTLSIAEQKICDTAENAQSCIPTGTHRVVIHTCKHYRRKMPVILIVPDSEC